MTYVHRPHCYEVVWWGHDLDIVSLLNLNKLVVAEWLCMYGFIFEIFFLFFLFISLCCPCLFPFRHARMARECNFPRKPSSDIGLHSAACMASQLWSNADVSQPASLHCHVPSQDGRRNLVELAAQTSACLRPSLSLPSSSLEAWFSISSWSPTRRPEERYTVIWYSCKG